jgi:CRISPR-associated protein Cmr2
MTTKQTYHAVTIGPIIETLERAITIRQLWGASYLFSYLIKKCCEELKNDYTIISPNINAVANLPHNGAGYFPDRLYLLDHNQIGIQKFKDTFVNQIKAIAEGVYDKLTEYSKPEIKPDNCFLYIPNSNFSKEAVQIQIENYLRCYFITAEIEASQPILKNLNALLDHAELTPKLRNEWYPDFLMDFLYRILNSFLVNDGFGKEFHHFKDVFDVSAVDLINKEIDKYKPIRDKHYEILNEIETIRKAANPDFNKLKKLENQTSNFLKDIIEKVATPTKPLLPFHKYFALVYADGDGVGSTISGYKTLEEIDMLSKALIQFDSQAVEAIIEYGGMPIYAGGDDLLFLAPVANNNKNIFSLCNDLDVRFKQTVGILSTNSKTKFSLSLGICISYFKHPLYESNNIALNNLKFKAKNAKLFQHKNAIALDFIKHSGQKTEILIDKNLQVKKDDGSQLNLFDEWCILLDKYAHNLRDVSGFLNSLTHRILLLDSYFKIAVKPEYQIKSFEIFFDNNFNEDEHAKGETKNFIKELSQFVYQLYKAAPDQAKDYIHGLLRMIDFLTKTSED